MNLRIIKAGVLDTVQDMGRNGYQHLGINPGGVMDKLSAQLANLLVGNNPLESVIELHFPASAFFFEQPAIIAVSGADFSASVNGEEIPTLHPVLLSKFSILQFHGIKKGARAYLAVQGGFDLPKWLGSNSTHLKAMISGYKGRSLQKDDEIPMRLTKDLCPLIGKKEFQVLPWKADVDPNEEGKDQIWILPGNEWHRLTQESKEKFLQGSFTITNQSDRMGFHLEGEPLLLDSPEEVISSAVSFGTVQLLHNGQMITLMADHQTTGGYPRIAHVISTHHSRLAQMKPGEAVKFQFTDHHQAESLLIKQQQHLRQLENACKLKLEQFLSHHD